MSGLDLDAIERELNDAGATYQFKVDASVARNLLAHCHALTAEMAKAESEREQCLRAVRAHAHEWDYGHQWAETLLDACNRVSEEHDSLVDTATMYRERAEKAEAELVEARRKSVTHYKLFQTMLDRAVKAEDESSKDGDYWDMRLYKAQAEAAIARATSAEATVARYEAVIRSLLDLELPATHESAMLVVTAARALALDSTQKETR